MIFIHNAHQRRCKDQDTHTHTHTHGKGSEMVMFVSLLMMLLPAVCRTSNDTYGMSFVIRTGLRFVYITTAERDKERKMRGNDRNTHQCRKLTCFDFDRLGDDVALSPVAIRHLNVEGAHVAAVLVSVTCSLAASLCNENNQ